MVLDPKLAFGLIAGAGAVIRGVYSFINKKKEDPSLKWSWIVFTSEAVPAFAFGFMAGAGMNQPLSAFTAITAFFFGMGFTSAIAKATTRSKKC